MPHSGIPQTESPAHWKWVNRFSGLGGRFYVEMPPQTLAEPYWVATSEDMMRTLAIEPSLQESNNWLMALSGNAVLSGSAPHASVYSGHQFGSWAGQLGDGRALWLGEIHVDNQIDSGHHELQLKGSGLTPFSRMGDGRAVLRSSIREFLASEAMAALGIATTRALCVTGSDEPVYRETPETAAVVTRVAPSFVRFGHFEHFSHSQQLDELRQLADFVIQHHYPACRSDERFDGDPYANLLREVALRTAEMIARWQAVGFCHGVMNTDNMSILGLTIDYGPFQFMDAYDPDHICNHSDHRGRYSFKNQPNAAYWNLMGLAQALLPLIGRQEHAVQAVELFKGAYADALNTCMAAKLGFAKVHAEQTALLEKLWPLLADHHIDHTIFWRRLSHWADGCKPTDHRVRDLFMSPVGIDAWLLQYSELVKQYAQGHSSKMMLNTNPKFVLRNYMAQTAIADAQRKDYSTIKQLQRVLESPFDEHPEHEAWAGFVPDWASGISISCSS
jgi:uncharacterized protein YdiU (UPF0061 family)